VRKDEEMVGETDEVIVEEIEVDMVEETELTEYQFAVQNTLKD
jgi:hypothetical protein